ncbi:hypothetical protein EON77_20525, partial [bacterium]
MRLSNRLLLAAALAAPSFVAGAFGTEHEAAAHARLTDPKPRTPDDAIKTNAPCGAVARTEPSRAYTEGAEVEIAWDETIDHAGCFVLTLLDDKETPYVVMKTIVDEGGTVIPSRETGTPYTTKLTLPEGVTCDKCTIQLRQVMSGTATCDPSTFGASTYFSCADVRISSADGGAPPPFDGPPVASDAGTDAPSGGGTGGGGTGGDVDAGTSTEHDGHDDAEDLDPVGATDPASTPRGG